MKVYSRRNPLNNYGKELILDMQNCDPTTFTRKHIRNYFKRLCSLIDMERADLHWWDDLNTPEKEKETEPHLKGTTAIQFIKTSNITIHTLDLLKSVYLNIFSCKDFDPAVVKKFTEEWFKGKIVNNHVIERK